MGYIEAIVCLVLFALLIMVLWDVFLSNSQILVSYSSDSLSQILFSFLPIVITVAGLYGVYRKIKR